MHVKRMLSAVCLALFLILSTHSVNAEIKTFVKEYTYQASEEDSRNSSRTVSLREVKRLLLEELGTYLEGITEVQNFRMTKDQIATLTAGIVSTEIVEEKWDGKVYWLKAKISADQESVIKSIDKLRQDRQKVKELEESRKRSEELLKENERLKKELAAKVGKHQETAQAYQRNIKNLTAAEWFEKGYALVTSYNYTSAVEPFTKAIELNPRLADAYAGRGATYRVLGNYQQAIKDCNKAIELNPQYAWAYFSRGSAYYELGNYQRAIKDFSKAIELIPQGAGGYYYSRGGVYHKLGNYQQAIKDFSKAIELNPQFADAYNNRGLAYGKLDNHQQAIKDIKIAARLGDEDAQDFLRRKDIAW